MTDSTGDSLMVEGGTFEFAPSGAYYINGTDMIVYGGPNGKSFDSSPFLLSN